MIIYIICTIYEDLVLHNNIVTNQNNKLQSKKNI